MALHQRAMGVKPRTEHLTTFSVRGVSLEPRMSVILGYSIAFSISSCREDAVFLTAHCGKEEGMWIPARILTGCVDSHSPKL